MIGIIDYGLGNIKAFSIFINHLIFHIWLLVKKSELEKVNKLILPGVGAFDDAMKKFKNSGLKISRINGFDRKYQFLVYVWITNAW